MGSRQVGQSSGQLAARGSRGLTRWRKRSDLNGRIQDHAPRIQVPGLCHIILKTLTSSVFGPLLFALLILSSDWTRPNHEGVCGDIQAGTRRQDVSNAVVRVSQWWTTKDEDGSSPACRLATSPSLGRWCGLTPSQRRPQRRQRSLFRPFSVESSNGVRYLWRMSTAMAT